MPSQIQSFNNRLKYVIIKLIKRQDGKRKMRHSKRQNFLNIFFVKMKHCGKPLNVFTQHKFTLSDKNGIFIWFYSVNGLQQCIGKNYNPYIIARSPKKGKPQI